MRRIGRRTPERAWPRRLAAALTALVCLATLSLAAAAAAASGPEGTEPPLRVLLRRLNLSDRAELTLRGRYLGRGENGMEVVFPRDGRMTLMLADGRILVRYEGAFLSAGASFTLTRLEDGGDGSDPAPGLYIGSAGLYPGDLRLTVSEGKLQAVLTLSMEDYLLGVVPYEMSDSFPLEALKAQAVCARTYAMNKMNPQREWDVVDTTNDQVFRGVSENTVNAARAVAETAGLLLTRNGRLVECYYSASNGGQTEIPAHVWGSGETAGKYEIADDPWDAGNPDSLTRSATLKKDGTGLYRRITGLIREAVFARPEWQKGGFSTQESDFRVDGFSAMALKTPRFDSPSRLMTELEITLTASGRKVAGGTLGGFESAGSLTITLPLFPAVKHALGLAINGTDNEIFTLTETEEAFRLTAGRFGHGVGLSQRGAQWMAQEGGKTFNEILAFYFPDSQIMKYEAHPAPLPTVPPAMNRTPAPEATPAPKPTLMPVSAEGLPEGAYLASVENIQDGTTLNLRAEPSPTAEVLRTLAKHQRLIVLDEMDVPGWARVRTDSIEGYVMRSYLERE